MECDRVLINLSKFTYTETDCLKSEDKGIYQQRALGEEVAWKQNNDKCPYVCRYEMIRIICCDHINKGIQMSLSNTILSNLDLSTRRSS